MSVISLVMRRKMWQPGNKGDRYMKKTAWLGLVLLVLLSACSSAGGNDSGTGTVSDTRYTEAKTGGEEDSGPAGNADPSKHVKLVIATYGLSEQVQKAVKKYEMLHPNIDIELQASSNSGKDLNDALAKHEQFVKNNNTALLAGSGPDVIELDELPSDQYVRRHLLADLNQLMKQDPDFHRELYFTNIMDHLQNDGGLYGMPLYFSLVGLFGDADAIGKAGVTFDDGNWSLSDFIDTARQLKQKGDYKYAFAEEPTALLGELVSENYAQLVTVTKGEAHFETDALADMMRQVKTMFDEDLVFNFHLGGRPATNVPQSGKAYFFGTELSSLRKAVILAPYPHTKLYAKPHSSSSGGGGDFKPHGTLGVNANSSHQLEAWDFIKFLLNDESVQSYIDALDASPGFPMNKAVYEQQMNKILRDGVVNTGGDSSTIKVDPVLLKQVDAYLSGAVNPVGGPSKLEKIIDNESKAFFAGQKSAEAAAKLIGNKINLQLNE